MMKPEELDRLLDGYKNAVQDLQQFTSLSETMFSLAKTKIQEIRKISEERKGEKLMVRPWAGIPYDELAKSFTDYETWMNSKCPVLLYRMAFIYLVAQFDAYLADAFELAILARPDVLKSKKQLSYEAILQHKSMDDLILYLAKRELHQLGYDSIRDQAKYYSDRFNVSLAVSGVPLDCLAEIRARRNLLVHNNGVVNHLYLDAVPGSHFKIGDSIDITPDYWKDSEANLFKVAEHIARTLIEKFPS